MAKNAQVVAPAKRSRESVMSDVCGHLEEGKSLQVACALVPDSRTQTVLDWVKRYPDLAGQYLRARETGYSLLADEIVTLSDKTHEWVTVQELDPDGNPVFDDKGEPRLKKVLMPLNSDVVAHKRLQIDTRKWMLSKMLPKIYGDKVTQEHTGAGGGPVQVAAVDLRGLNDSELEQMQTLLGKASGG